MFNKAEELIKLCNENNKRISEIVIEKEIKNADISYDELMNRMRDTLSVMKSSATSALDKEVKSVSGLTGGDSKKVEEYKNSGNTLSGSLIVSAMAKALSTSEINASMGRIVAAPTAGASGIVPSALLSAKEKLNLTDDQLIMGLFTAAGIGEIVAKNATVSGAEGGCQAECGTAAAMAAAAIVEMAGGTPESSFNAASFALVNIMGLVCDPIGGLVEYPCALRNASGVVNALTSADLALAGVKSLVPFDEVVEAMYKVGKLLPESLRETALGGVATTPTGERLRREIQH
ncbi:L-serine ammonia-lyase, iron-sulfur-dependent, subunit alpha [Tissierella carlieri]|jgi:L-serine dehydratase|uniref:L-serine ammonia-lyase, iron-sulfur-dependent, subunit alpha n=1 Tax=Tissierella carlieri TaxID=689904 RepID=UPI001C10A49B|nr:L-serine ammonia-lyase, iron-sulfur-dependent, subunit alpha [Tissierella carlieri]MBU5311700.1 L-serine ammonia-lyase, iron-sulfur-dependent, subunit alpha [Tissierella carlieri]MDU5082285.1 L-serine ammonia-lyase, iron-sulfur-dependent, subunit alpha [Bacillota bacterium]